MAHTDSTLAVNGTSDPTMNGVKEEEANFRSNILEPSDDVPEGTPVVSGVEFDDFKDRNITVAEMMDRMTHTGYQATSVADAVGAVNTMRSWQGEKEIFLGFTSNLVSSGLRSTLRWLVQHKHVTCLVATAGGIEEDLIKCLAPTYCSTFTANDAALRDSHINRIGNLRVPNSNYLLFEDWLTPILNTMLDEQEASHDAFLADRDTLRDAWLASPARTTKSFTTPEDTTLHWTPSTFIARLGKLINDPSSICYWASRNSIPIYCPAITDGSIGDMLAQHTIRSRNRPRAATLSLDITRDIDSITRIARHAQLYHRPMGAVILGGGLVKHHIMNACLQGGGADAAVYINTGIEADGSDAGAKPEEAVSWGKLKAEGTGVKVWGEATVVWPLIVAATWARI